MSLHACNSKDAGKGMYIARTSCQPAHCTPALKYQKRRHTGEKLSPGRVAAAGGIAAPGLASLVLHLCADDLLMQAVIEGPLHAAHSHPLVYVLTRGQGQLVT